MAEYLIEITETLSRTYAVKAENSESALEMIRNAIYDSKIVLDADDFVSRDIKLAVCADGNYPEYSENNKKRGELYV